MMLRLSRDNSATIRSEEVPQTIWNYFYSWKILMDQVVSTKLQNFNFKTYYKKLALEEK